MDLGPSSFQLVEDVCSCALIRGFVGLYFVGHDFLVRLQSLMMKINESVEHTDGSIAIKEKFYDLGSLLFNNKELKVPKDWGVD